MLLPKDINPTNTLYYNGALTLKVLEDNKQTNFDFLDLYSRVKQVKEISLQSYVLSLDWLFILGSIKLDRNGKIEKCF
jgi:hypothetical protein